jgi:hypothetical protein
MKNISSSMNRIFTLGSFNHSSSPKPESRRQLPIQSFPENNVEPRIDIHSIEYDFPLEKKATTKVAEPGSVGERLSVSVQTRASEPTYQDSASRESESPKPLSNPTSAVMDSTEEVSGFSVESFFDSIRFGESSSLKLHIESGFKGSQERLVDAGKYNAFDYAMHCKNFDALMALAPTVKASNIIEALEKNPLFIHEYRSFSMQLFNALN